jgi:hypothetical protein
MKKNLSKIDEQNLLNEGVWEKTKYLLSKLGRYKAGGRIFGKSQVDAEAKQEIDDILKKSERGFIQNLDTWIKQNNPQFPNNEKEELFLQTVEQIAMTYDSIVAATKLPNTDPGFLPVEMADRIISGLRRYVKKALDVDLAAVYSGLDEDYNYEEDIDLSEDAASDARERLKQKRQQQGGGEEFKSSRMDTLKSNKLPLLLAGLGTSLGGLSWLVNTEWFKSLFTTKSSIKEIIDTLKETLNYNAIKPGEGLTQIMNRTQGLNLSPTSSPEDFLRGVSKIGGGDLKRGIDLLSTQGGIFTNPDAARGVLENIATNPHGHGNTLGEIFQGTWAGTGANAGDLLVTKPGGILFNIIVNGIKKEIIKTTTSTGAAYLAAKGLGSLLGPIGIGLIATGAAVKLFRLKGQNQSRAATLNLLFQTIRDITPTKENPIVIGNTEAEPQNNDKGGKSILGNEPDIEDQDSEQQPQDSEQQPQDSEQQPQGGEAKVTITGDGKKKGKRGQIKADADAEVIEPNKIGAGERENQKQIGGSKKQPQLTGGQTTDTEELKTSLGDFFKEVLRIKPKRKQQQIAEEKEFDLLNPFKDKKTLKQIEDFQKSGELLSALAKKIDSSLRNPNVVKDVNLKNLLIKIKQNPQHKNIVNIRTLIKDNIKNRDLIIRFISIYLNAIKSTRFGQIQKYIKSDEEKNPTQLKEVALRGQNSINKFLNNFDVMFKIYLTDLYRLLVYLNKPTKKTNTGQLELDLKEGEKKNKYSKKASEFIGKEISHLKKDKGYPQDRAVAAAINVAKEKGMKVGKKSNLKENKLKNIAAGLALGAGLMGSPQTKGQDYVNPNYSSTSKVTNAVNSEEINNLKKLNYVLSQIYDVEGHDDYKKPIESSLEGIQKGIKEHLGINVVIRPDVYEKFIQEIKNNNSDYVIVNYKGMNILKWR